MSIIVDNNEAPKSLAVALSPLPPVAATGTRADSVFDLLRASIVQGELAPGSKINEPQLSKLYGISRGPLREAIRRLEGCKLVEIKANVGARVVELDIQKAIEIYEIREALEGLACGLAAERATASDCDQLRTLLARQLYHLLRLYRVQTSSQPSRPAQAFKEHHRIVDAIEERDSVLAELLMRRHIASAKATLLAQLESDSEPGLTAATPFATPCIAPR